MWEFPIILGHGEHARFTLNTIMTLPGCAARIQSITLVEITRDTRVIKALAADGRLAIHDNPGTPSTISIE